MSASETSDSIRLSDTIYDQRGQWVEEQTNIAGDQHIYTGDMAYDVRGLTNPYLGGP